MGFVIKPVKICTELVGCRTVDAIFDTASDFSYIDPDFADEIGAIETGRIAKITDSGFGQSGNREVKVRELSVNDLPTIPLLFKRPIKGFKETNILIGNKHMQTLNLKIDMEKDEIWFEPLKGLFL